MIYLSWSSSRSSFMLIFEFTSFPKVRIIFERMESTSMKDVLHQRLMGLLSSPEPPSSSSISSSPQTIDQEPSLSHSVPPPSLPSRVASPLSLSSLQISSLGTLVQALSLRFIKCCQCGGVSQHRVNHDRGYCPHCGHWFCFAHCQYVAPDTL